MAYRTFTLHTIHLITHRTAGTASDIYAPDICICFAHILCPNGRFASYVSRQDSKGYTDHSQCIHLTRKDLQQQALHPAYMHLTYAFVLLLYQGLMAALPHMFQGGILWGLQTTHNAYIPPGKTYNSRHCILHICT